MKQLVWAVALLFLGTIAPAHTAPPVFGGWATNEEDLPHLEAAHEWWYFAIQSSSSTTSCGPWQAMVSFVRDAEALGDRLLFTTIVDGTPADRSIEHLPASTTYAVTEDVPTSRYIVSLGDSSVDVGRFDGTRRLTALSGNARLDVVLTATTETLWHRRVPEGAGILDITLAPRASVTGTLTIGTTVCPVDGLGSFEHVWGTWSRVPMWGVDFLAAHAGGWSVVARRTPMRGETRIPTNALAKPVMIVTDGTKIFEAASTSFQMSESATPHPTLGIPIPTGYEVTGTGFGSAASTVTLDVGAPSFADILLPLTSSAILEGWAPATITVDGVSHTGTSETEFQRYGTRYPH